MEKRYTVAVVFGTRPEAIKLIPIVHALQKVPVIRVHVYSTGQHREMLEQVLSLFDLNVDCDFHVMTQNQTLAGMTEAILHCSTEVFLKDRPDLVLVQGDTTSVAAVALAAFYLKIPVGHVEAGLRTGKKYSPFPEEMNRRIATCISELHFAPTRWSAENLRREGIEGKNIYIVGNPVIDTLQIAVKKNQQSSIYIKELPADLQPGTSGRRLCLITGHRRENFGDGFEKICMAIKVLAEKYPECAFVYPVHLNPAVRQIVFTRLGNGQPANIFLITPQEYLAFVGLMKRAFLVLSDSGGVQEEAPALGKPVLVMREDTERPEGVLAGTCRLVGTCPEKIISEFSLLYDDEEEYIRRSNIANPYGDGTAGEQIADICTRFLETGEGAR